LAFLFIFGCFFVQTAFSGGSSASKSTPPAPAPPTPAERLNSAQSRVDEAQTGMSAAFEDIDSEPTLEDQYFLGRAVAATILNMYKPYTANPELTRYLNLICQALLINSPSIGLFNGCYVQILDSPELNAFASPGGHIFITKALVEATTSEDMLAAIIAHELAHIKLKHGMKMIEEMRIFETATAMANRAYDFSGRDSAGAQRLMGFRASVTAMIDTMLRNGYSQVHEFEADKEAIALLAAAGYDPEAMIAVFKVLYDAQGGAGFSLNTTHPSVVERVRYADTWISQYSVQDNRQSRAARFFNK